MTRLDKFMMTMRMRFFTSTDLRHGTHGNSGYSGRVGVYRRLIIWFGEEAYLSHRHHLCCTSHLPTFWVQPLNFLFKKMSNVSTV